MPRFVCHHKGVFFEWSTVVDAPVTIGMSLDEFSEYYKAQYGEYDFEREFEDRIERATAKGTSSLQYTNLRELVQHNRAGPYELSVPFDRLMKALANGEQTNRIPESECERRGGDDD